MQIVRTFLLGAAAISLASAAHAKINVVVVHNINVTADAGFKLRSLPAPSAADAATSSKISIIDGRRDANGGDLDQLQDGKVPTQPDEPAKNFFFAAGTSGGRLLIDLGRPLAIEQVNTFSWHRGSRGPQMYALYASDGASDGFRREPTRQADPNQSGWTLVAQVDTRPTEDTAEAGGQYGVSIFDSEGTIGPYRYLLFDVARADDSDPFGNTFFSEIDVVAGDAAAAAQPLVVTMKTDRASYRATIDTSETPDLSEWAAQQLAPVVVEWYPKIVELLPSEGFQAPTSFSITFSPSMRGVAATGGTQIRCSANWFRQNRDGEAIGAVVHELVHVVQQYRWAGRRRSDAGRPPGWLVEGIPDYIRWFLYEPQSGGAEINQRNLADARYDGSYRVSANFLNWVVEQHGGEIVPQLNAALREGRYNDSQWKELTGQTVEELAVEWKAGLERRIADQLEESTSSGG